MQIHWIHHRSIQNSSRLWADKAGAFCLSHHIQHKHTTIYKVCCFRPPISGWHNHFERYVVHVHAMELVDLHTFLFYLFQITFVDVYEAKINVHINIYCTATQCFALPCQNNRYPLKCICMAWRKVGNLRPHEEIHWVWQDCLQPSESTYTVMMRTLAACRCKSFWRTKLWDPVEFTAREHGLLWVTLITCTLSIEQFSVPMYTIQVWIKNRIHFNLKGWKDTTFTSI